MKTTQQQSDPDVVWLFYDGECPVCCRWIDSIQSPLSRHHVRVTPQQSELGRTTLGLKQGEVLSEMKVRLSDGVLLGGADAALYVAQFLWWARPFRFLARLPGGLPLLRRLYNWFAASRYCFSGRCKR